MASRTIKYPARPGAVLHVYNRALGSEKLFLQPADYELFMSRITKYLLPCAELYAFCLISNHYHLLLRVNDGQEPAQFPIAIGSMLKSYTNRYNLKYARRGALFQGRYRRREVKESSYFRKLLVYIHANPVKHRVCDHPAGYRYCSYLDYLRNSSNILQLGPGVEAFDSVPNMVFVHENAIERYRDRVP